jgi:hypothetical protein
MQVTNRKFGIEIEFVGVTRDAVACALRAAGIEAYVEGYNHTTRPYWKIVTDGSLQYRGQRRTPYAGELVSPVLQGAEGLEQLKTVCEVLTALPNCTVNRSCGLHVHLDCQRMTVGEIAKVFERYAKYESQLDLVMPRSRRGNSRWCDSIAGREESIKRCDSKTRQGAALGRFYKVNLTNVSTRGAIEFRQHSGTTDFHKIANWLVFLQQFVEKSIELAAVRPVPQKSRFFNQVRNAIEKAGFTLDWDRRAKKWRYVEQSTGNTGHLTNDELFDCYGDIPKNQYKSQRHDVVDTDAVRELLFRQLSLSHSKAWEIAHTYDSYKNGPRQFVLADDNGLLDGISQQVADYLEERREELN